MPVGRLDTSEAEVLDLADAQAVALGIFLLRRGAAVDVVTARWQAEFGYDLAPERALAGAITATDFAGAIRTAVCLGGDTDTSACITGGVAEILHGLPETIAEAARARLTPDLLDALDRFHAAVDA